MEFSGKIKGRIASLNAERIARSVVELRPTPKICARSRLLAERLSSPQGTSRVLLARNRLNRPQISMILSGEFAAKDPPRGTRMNSPKERFLAEFEAATDQGDTVSTRADLCMGNVALML